MTADPAALLDQEARKLAGLEGLLDDQLRGVQFRQATIVSYNGGTGLATIRLGGDTTNIAGVRHLSSYTPAASDTGVWVAMIGTSPLLLGAVGGGGAVQAGTVAVGVDNSSHVFSAGVTFPVAFAVAPTVVVSHDQGSGGALTVIASARSVTTTGFSAFIRSSTSAAFGGSTTYNVSWLAI